MRSGRPIEAPSKRHRYRDYRGVRRNFHDRADGKLFVITVLRMLRKRIERSGSTPGMDPAGAKEGG